MNKKSATPGQKSDSREFRWLLRLHGRVMRKGRSAKRDANNDFVHELSLRF
jgi:hypothetical protein